MDFSYELKSKIYLNIKYIHTYNHFNNISPKTCCRGIERLNQALKLSINGPANCLSQNILNNKFSPNCKC